MASNNIILAVPSANSSVNYELPQSESAKLSFSPEDIDGLKLDASGGLVISFVEGGQVTLTNFQSFIDNGNTLSLADGTNVDPKLLFNALGGTNDNAFPTAASDAIKIDVPAANAQNEIKLEPGQKYLMNFDLSETTGANVKDGQMVIGFANGGKIVITNYETAMADKMPPELSLASKTCVVTGDELITNIQKLAATEVVVEEKEEETKAKSKIADADMQGEDNSGIVDPTKLGYKAEEKKAEATDADAQKVANVEPAAGEEADIARQLAQIETAAGPGGGAAGRAGGYGYGSRFAPDPFATNPDIGPISPTQLQYRAPILTPSEFIANNDDNPIAIAPGAQFVDETNLDNGPLVVSGGINIDFGADGPGGVSPNGDFSSGGSQTGGVLSANGQPITVTVVGNTYIGVTSGGDKVFELTINPNNGDYTYTQYIAIDHADKTNPNDQIILNFGVTAKDSDGDSVSTKIQIVVADDAPVIEGSSAKVDETDFGATISASGNLVHDYNQDGPGKIEATGSFTSGGSQKDGVLSAGGVPVTVTQTATGYEGKANGVLVFTLTINPSTGDYTYTQFKNLDHADGSNPNDEITLTFGAKITDYDGDSATAPIVITVVDDGPDFQSCGCGPKPDKGLEIVDETNLKNGPAIETGKLDADFGADAPGSYGFKDGSFTSSGSKTGGQLTHNGIPVVVTLVNGTWVGTAGNETIFKLELNTSTGDYKFTLYDNLDHADKTNPDDQIVLDFGVVASDFDGDKADGSIRIIVKDDGPVANDDINTYDTTFGVANGNVVTGLNGGPGAADVLSTDGWTATDSSNKVVKIAFGGNEVDVPATGTVSIDGQYGTLTIAADGTYTYKAFDNGGMIDHGGQKEFASGPALPDFDESEALDGVEQQSLGVAPGNLSLNGGETISVTFRSEGASYNNSMGVFSIGPNGELKYETVLIKNGNAAVPGQTYSYTAGADATAVGFFIVANGADHGLAKFDLNTGTLNFVYDYGLPTQRDAKVTDDGSHIKLVYTDSNGATTVVPVPVYFTSDRGGMDNLNADDSVRVVSGIPGSDDHVLRIGFEDLPGLGDKDFNDMVFDVTITAPSCGCGDPDIKDEFVYTLQDGDGDQDKATLTLNGQDLTDDKPILATPAIETVDETNLTGGAITETGKINADFGHDGPGTLSGNGSFTSGGSKLGGNLTSGGAAVNVSLSGDTYTGKTANGTVVFTLKIASDGSYTFKLFEQLDHADGSNPNDAITLNFGVDAIDCDGDKTGTTLTVKVLDDAPDAKDDTNSAGEGQTVTGNVKNNDVVGQDTPGTITKVVFGNQTFDLPANGSNVVITGQFGKLTINNTGAYSYTANTNNPNGVDTFTYTLKDSDGDTDTATLKINVTCTDDVPVITPAIETIDETNLSGGVITETGSVSANFGSDGPGAITANGAFVSGGSKLGGNLTSGGQTVNVTLNGSTYEGKTAGGVTVFTLQVAANGSYTFKLFEQLDHADGSNPNDSISLQFGVTGTDADGDAVNSTITVNVLDDAPDAKDDGNAVAESGTVTGNVTNNDVVGQDIPGKVTKVSFNGTSYDVPVNGANIVINGAYGKLTINNTGAYSYTANSNNPQGTDQFVYTLRDNDGDTDTACLSISVTCNDDIPTITPAIETIDETNLASGVITETGTVTATYGSDGPGAISANGSFTSGGSKLGGNLTHQGQAVNVTLSGDTYTGKTAGGVTVFTLQVAANGSYTFKLFEQLDHADGSNPNDVISLNFGVTATDNDGDAQSSTITINVKDDAPDAKDDGNTAAENQTVTGNVTNNDVVGQDVVGTVTKVSFNGTSYNVPTTGSLQIVGTYGTLTIDKTGAYSYTAKNNVDGTDQFAYTLRDNDGDTDTACLSITVSSQDDCPIIVKPADEIVDETNLVSGTITETGTVSANYFGDGPGAISANGSFASGGSKLGGNLTSGGAPVTVSLSGDTYTGKTANGTVIFTLQVAANGSYTFKLFEQLDHADGNNPNDIITLDFGVTATDADGDTASTTITVKVKDDAPDAKDDGNSVAESGTVTGNVTNNDVVGQDVPGKVTKISFNGQNYDVPANGSNVTINGAFGKLTINNTGAYSYTANSNNPNGTDQFTYTLRDNDGDTDTACLSISVSCNDDIPTITPAIETIDETNLAGGVITETGTVTATYGSDGPGAITANGSFTSGGSKLAGNLTHQGQAVNVTLSGDTYTGKTAGGVTVFTLQVSANGNYTFKLFEQLDHADGSNPNDVISLQFGVTATDADGDAQSSTITINVKDDAPDAKDDGNTAAENQTVTGNVTNNDVVGQDVVGTVTKIVFNGTTYNVPTTGSVQIVGTYGTLTIDKTGAYSYTAKNNVDGTDQFAYTLRDNDGDTDTACLSITVSSQDDCPIIVKPADEIVDETNLVSGTITETGTVSANYFGDGPGAITANGSFTSGGSKLNGNLTHQGQAVNVTLSGDTYTGKTAGGTVVFTLQVAANGNYTFKLFEQLDHADGSNPNDIITLDFGVTATDADGDQASTTITVKVKDDAPDAKDDGNAVAESGTVTGNVTNNDVVGQDVPGKVTKISFGGQSYDVPANGANIVINGAYGKLTINNTGAYSYTANSNNPQGTDQFTYTLKDNDGDTDTACLSISVTCNDDIPTITPAIETIDETNLASGVITETGTVTATYGNDGPGAISANGSFTSGGSKLGGNLTSGGTPVTVSLSGDTYTGKTAAGVTIFTLQVGANGNYTFKLFEQLDHADGSNPNDVISLNFGVTATDADGDAQTSTITVNVKDDAPDAKDDGNAVAESGTVTGNVTNNDVVGQDVPGKVTKISFGGQSYDVPANGANIVINGAYGKLTINNTGAYSYTANSNNPNGTDAFTYTLRDNDGDTDTACLSISVTCNDDVPVITPAIETIDETNLAGGVITETGSITVNYGGDGPGTVAANGSFVSGGSKLGGNLTHQGQAVNVTLSGDTYTGKTAGGVTVFTLQVAANGSYTFKLFEQLDHADGSNPNDIISLQFGVTATDADGDTQTSTITVNVKDDAPDAKDDGRTVVENQTVTGNVTSNDVVGQDVVGTVTKVVFNGTSYNVPTTGSLQIVGTYGTLNIDKTGAYSYTAKNNADGVDSFVYTLRDNDGDTDTACLSLTVTNVDDCPTITPAIETVDETNLASGVITETGSVTANYYGDGPGAISANGSFTSGGSKLNGNLTHNGQPVSVSLSGNTYTGTTAGGTTVFTLVVAANGSYTFKLFEQLDHADGTNPNDIISLNFGVTATDADGDTANATITVNVKDDAPIANDDSRQMVNGTSTINGNVTDNDVVGQDTPGNVTKISFNGTTKDVPVSGTVTIDGQYGSLVIDHTGAYTYTAKPGAIGTDSFTYILKDNDGDTDPACLSIEVKPNPLVVCIFADDQCVKEDGHVGVPVNAYYTGASGNETMTITLTGVPAGWTITAPGWTYAGGVYTLVLAQGVTNWNGTVDFKPPANSDVDLNGLIFKASVYDPDNSSTTFATEDVNIIVDAVVEPFTFKTTVAGAEDTSNINFFLVTNQAHTERYQLSIKDVTHTDTDGSESIKKVIFTLEQGMDPHTYIAVQNLDGSFSKVGVKGADGADTTYTIDLTGMTYAQAVDYLQNKLYLVSDGNSYLDGGYDLDITLVKYEKNLSGIEKDYSDNETSYTVTKQINYCLSPLVIDMDRDGIELLSKEHGVMFDMTKDGVKDHTGWVAKDDALLVLDKNHDGLINDRSELFGNDENYANGFDSLAAYDSNKDGVIDSKDAVFNDLRVWQDLNSDGISQENEMRSLHDVNIAAIKLGATDVNYQIAGNSISHESTVIYGDGSNSAIVDAWFAYDNGARAGVDKGLHVAAPVTAADAPEAILVADTGTKSGNELPAPIIGNGPEPDCDLPLPISDNGPAPVGNDDQPGVPCGYDPFWGWDGKFPTAGVEDKFLFQTITEASNKIKDFQAGIDDRFDISDVVSHGDSVSDAINDFVFAKDNGDSHVRDVATADAPEAAHQFAVADTGNVNVTDLFNNGSIIV